MATRIRKHPKRTNYRAVIRWNDRMNPLGKDLVLGEKPTREEAKALVDEWRRQRTWSGKKVPA